MPEESLSAEFTNDPFDALPELGDSLPVEAETTPTPAEAPAAEAPQENTDPYGLRALADEQRELVKSQRAQIDQASRPAAPQGPTPLMQNEAWKAKYFEAASASGYDQAAQMNLLQMNQELANESATNMQANMRREMQAQYQADASMGTLRTEARSVLGDLVDDTTLNDVTNQVFGGDRTLMGNALQDPNVRQLVIDAAAGRKMRSGQAAPTNAPARSTPPASVQSSARDTRPSADNDDGNPYNDARFADAWKNPEKYAPKRK